MLVIYTTGENYDFRKKANGSYLNDNNYNEDDHEEDDILGDAEEE